jgi:hypothetical protein
VMMTVTRYYYCQLVITTTTNAITASLFWVPNTMASKCSKTTPSQDVMLEHLAYLVLHENRPASWRDFQKFIVDGKEYSLKQGTIRNNLSQLRVLGLIEFAYRSINAYFTLPGENRWKRRAMTLNHARVYKRDLADLIERMAFDTPAVHDIHLRFKSQVIWQTLTVLASSSAPSLTTSTTTPGDVPESNASSTNTPAPLSTRPVSKDLVLPELTLENGIKGKVTIHKSDTVSVILSCSESPIKFDMGGLVSLSSSLARIEEKLLTLIDTPQRQMLMQLSSASSPSSSVNPVATTTAPILLGQLVKNGAEKKKKVLLIPDNGSWTVTMWHFGRDSIERYNGEKFEAAWEDFRGEWIRAYSKEMTGEPYANNRKKAHKKQIVRIERQEYPRERLRAVVEQKLSSIMVANIFSTDATS